MRKRVKVIINDRLEEIETDINCFLQTDPQIELVDVKIQLDNNTSIAIIIYKK